MFWFFIAQIVTLPPHKLHFKLAFYFRITKLDFGKKPQFSRISEIEAKMATPCPQSPVSILSSYHLSRFKPGPKRGEETSLK